MIAGSDRIRAGDGVTAREFDGEWIILDLRAGNYYGLNAVGGNIWVRLEKGETIQEIASKLALEYEVSDAVVLKDVLSLVAELMGKGLVSKRDDP